MGAGLAVASSVASSDCVLSGLVPPPTRAPSSINHFFRSGLSFAIQASAKSFCVFEARAASPALGRVVTWRVRPYEEFIPASHFA